MVGPVLRGAQVAPYARQTYPLNPNALPAAEPLAVAAAEEQPPTGAGHA
jgi:hypothetical protein